MDMTLLTIIAIVVVFAATLGISLVLLMTVRKISKSNTVVSKKLSAIVWQELACPKCKITMDEGFSLTGRGIIWRARNEKLPGPLSNIGSVLENSISLNLQPALNLSWRCSHCKLVVIDHAKMVKVKK